MHCVPKLELGNEVCICFTYLYGVESVCGI